MRRPNTTAAHDAVAPTLSPADIVGRLTRDQKMLVITDAAQATAAGKPLRRYRGFDAGDVLRTFRGNQAISETLSRILNIGHDVKLSEAAEIIALRNGFTLLPPKITEERVIEMERERIKRGRHSVQS